MELVRKDELLLTELVQKERMEGTGYGDGTVKI